MDVTKFTTPVLNELYRRVDEKIYQRRDRPIWENWTFNRVRDRISLVANRRYIGGYNGQ